jgi:disulfide oxidoreductase YuzD
MRKFAVCSLLALLALCFVGGARPFPKKKHKHKHKAEQAADSTQTTMSAEPPPLTKHERKMLKKKEKHERKLKRRQEKYASHHRSKAPVVKKRQAFVYPATVMRSKYRIDVLADMYLDEIKGDKIPEKAQTGFTFYEGINIAADSLKKAGYNIDIYVHDVSSALEAPDKLISDHLLDSSDLIIAAVMYHDLPALSEYAKAKGINFISALSASDGGVRNDPFFTMIQPSLRTHCEWINADIARKFPGMRVSLLYKDNSEGDMAAYNAFINDDSDRLTYHTLLCNSLPVKDSLNRLFDSTRPNVVIVSVLETNAADSILREITNDFPGTHFEVYGMPSWNTIPGLYKDDAYPNLSVYVPAPFNIDRNSPLAKYVSNCFRKQYGSHTPEMTYRGAETMFWYANLLKQYGTIFNNNYSDNSAAPFTHFDVRPKWDKDGGILYQENTHVFMTRYEGGVSRTE